MGLSINEYANRRGQSPAAVRKAISTGRIRPEPDGTIDPTKADADWVRNTDASQQRGNARTVQSARTPAAQESIVSGGTTFTQARTASEVIKAQTNKIRLSKLKSELVDRSQALALVFKLARSERDAWLNLPNKRSAQMAAALNADPHATHLQLEKIVREHLLELGELRLKVDE